MAAQKEVGMSHWARDYHDDVDNMRLDDLVSWHSDDAIVRIGPAHGKDEIAESIGQSWSMIGGLKHSFVNMWDLDGTSIVEANVDYTRADGGTSSFRPHRSSTAPTISSTPSASTSTSPSSSPNPSDVKAID